MKACTSEADQPGFVLKLQEYIASGGDVYATDKQNLSLLMRLVVAPFADACKVLIDAGADVNFRGNDNLTALMTMISNIQVSLSR